MHSVMLLRALRKSRLAATTRAAACTRMYPMAAPPSRSLGAGYTGEREAGYDEAQMNELRALGDTPFVMLNLLKIVNLELWTNYYTAVDEKFKAVGAENLYSGKMSGAPVPIKAEGIDTSEYNLVLLNKFPSADAFFELIDSAEYQAAYHFRFNSLEKGKSSLIVTFNAFG